jgi:ATP-dependent RNA helicase SUPV3L1/SUV3
LDFNNSYRNYIEEYFKSKSKDKKSSKSHSNKFKYHEPEAQPVLDLFVYHLSNEYKAEWDAIEFMKKNIDIRSPDKWFPAARKMKRKIIYHMGPTNSGKTYEALQALMKAKNGIYCAPLRLLAWEVNEKLLSNGIKSSLVTGQEVIEVPNSTHISCTVEKADVTRYFECAIIDEIQLISDTERGFSWTQALLGLQAEEIHICGDERALKLVYELCKITGDDLIRKRYKRLGDLVVMEDVVDMDNLKPGDCLISFSKKEVIRYKMQINSHPKLKNDNANCSIIYGALPPETKKLQAKIFNEEANQINYLVATDAVIIIDSTYR